MMNARGRGVATMLAVLLATAQGIQASALHGCPHHGGTVGHGAMAHHPTGSHSETASGADRSVEADAPDHQDPAGPCGCLGPCGAVGAVSLPSRPVGPTIALSTRTTGRPIGTATIGSLPRPDFVLPFPTAPPA